MQYENPYLTCIICSFCWSCHWKNDGCKQSVSYWTLLLSLLPYSVPLYFAWERL